MDEPSSAESREWLHQVTNHLSVIIGYCDLLLVDIPEGDRKHADILEVHRAATAAMTLVRERQERR